jgi:hypothetical protein
MLQSSAFIIHPHVHQFFRVHYNHYILRRITMRARFIWHMVIERVSFYGHVSNTSSNQDRPTLRLQLLYTILCNT